MKNSTAHSNTFLNLSYVSIVVVGMIQCFLGKDALADRSIAPVDSLGDWAIDTKLQCCGPWEKDHAYVTQAGNPTIQEISAGRIELQLRVWPVEGLFIGARGGVASLTGDESRTWAKENGVSQRALTDLVVEGGYRKRLTASIVVGGSTHISLATGSAWATRDRTDAEGRALVGFSFTPHWDFYVEPRVGLRSSASLSADGYRAGWSAGFSYQRAHFNLSFYGGNLWHRDSTTANYTSGIGGVTVGWEVSPGLNLSVEVDGNNDSNGTIRELGTRDRTQSEIIAGFALHWVFYPGDRRNVLRKPDAERGADWKWWNPGQPL